MIELINSDWVFLPSAVLTTLGLVLLGLYYRKKTVLLSLFFGISVLILGIYTIFTSGELSEDLVCSTATQGNRIYCEFRFSDRLGITRPIYNQFELTRAIIAHKFECIDTDPPCVGVYEVYGVELNTSIGSIQLTDWSNSLDYCSTLTERINDYIRKPENIPLTYQKDTKDFRNYIGFWLLASAAIPLAPLALDAFRKLRA